MKLSILNSENKVIAQCVGDNEINLVYKENYNEGDKIVVEVSGVNKFYWLQIDECLGKSLVYIKDVFEYYIPFGDSKLNLSPKAFEGDRHFLTIKEAKEFEYNCYRNLSLNVNDHHKNTSCFPHASANVETRNEATFVAMNAIDGVIAPESHGKWPYQSWGINRQDDAKWRLDFGRTILTDRIIIYLRADFPHDNWWTQGKITFSDNSEMIVHLKKGGQAQQFLFEKKEIEWLEFSELIKADDPSPFPALTQFEVYGIEK